MNSVAFLMASFAKFSRNLIVLTSLDSFVLEMSEGTELKINSPLWLLGECYYLEGSENSLEGLLLQIKQRACNLSR